MCGRRVPAIVKPHALRCLIVDDNDEFREEMGALLQEQGISVVGGASRGAEALRQSHS
jgi:DNA-binding NarL/FixJ family response regulator